MNDTEYAEAWMRTHYRFQPNEESLVHLLAEYLLIRNDPLPRPSWSTPGPPLRKQWKAQMREFDEECHHQGIPEAERPRCLRKVIERYRMDWKGKNPMSLRALIPYIQEYEKEGSELNKYREQFRKYTEPDLPYPYEA
jgi:hypothetical protein